MLPENIPAAVDAVQAEVRTATSGQDLIVQCPNTGDDIEVRFDEFGAAAIRNDDGEIVAVLQVQVVRID
jgi:hypothetical protein